MKDTCKLIIGIDPGKGGGVAFLDQTDSTYYCMKFPKELGDLSPIIEGYVNDYKAKDIYVIIEHVHSFPTDSRPAAFSFGRNLGHWEGILSTYELEWHTVAPRTWQEHYDIPVIKNKHERKNWLKDVAKSLFPKTKVTLHTSDALLIANYAKEMQYYNKKKGKSKNGKSNSSR